MHSTRKRRLIGGGITVAVLVAAGLAYAAWTASGTGAGYAQAGTAKELTTTDVSRSTVADLFPGGKGDVIIQIDNPNPYPVRVTDVTGNGEITPDAEHPGCKTTGVTFSDQADLKIDIEPNGSQTATLDDAASMSNESSDGCQGATFTIPVSLSGASNAP